MTTMTNLTSPRTVRGRPAREGLGSARIIAAVNELREAEIALHDAVIDARRLGDTWASIGESLGITRQAARQRYGESARNGRVHRC